MMPAASSAVRITTGNETRREIEARPRACPMVRVMPSNASLAAWRRRSLDEKLLVDLPRFGEIGVDLHRIDEVLLQADLMWHDLVEIGQRGHVGARREILGITQPL